MRRRRPKRRWLRWLLLLIVIDAAAFYWWWNNQVERRYNGIIRDAAAEFGVEHALIKARNGYLALAAARGSMHVPWEPGLTISFWFATTPY